MNRNGNKPKADDPTSANAASQLTDDERVNLTLTDMEQTERCQALSDLELIAEILQDEQLSLDPRVYELMTRLYPDWTNDVSLTHSTNTPRYIAFAVPYLVAYNVATFSHCRCSEAPKQPDAPAPLYKPCVFCAARASLFRSTKDRSFAPEQEENE